MRSEPDTLLRTLFILIWVIAILHLGAEHYYWYWQYQWFDLPMHLLGGVWLGLASLWVWNHTSYLTRVKKRVQPTDFVVALVGGVLFGLLWESYEYLVWTHTERGLPIEYVPDLIMDLCMDTLGAVVGYGVYRVTMKHHRFPSETEKTPV
jgi:hypothetical protein